MSANPAQTTEPQEFIRSPDYTFTGEDYTVERKWLFIEALYRQGSVYHAALASGVSRRTVYLWIENDPEFSEAVEDCKQGNYDNLEASVYKRAFKSDLLAMFYLKAHRPKFRDKIQINVNEVQEHIDSLMAKLNQRQLPAVMTEFIDTSYSQDSQEYEPIHNDLDSDQKQ